MIQKKITFLEYLDKTLPIIVCIFVGSTNLMILYDINALNRELKHKQDNQTEFIQEISGKIDELQESKNMEKYEGNTVHIIDLKERKGILTFNVGMQEDFIFKNVWIIIKDKKIMWNPNEFDISDQLAQLIYKKAMDAYSVFEKGN